MRKATIFLTGLILAFSVSSFKQVSRDKPLATRELKQGDTLYIGDRAYRKVTLREAYYKRGAYDGTRYFLHTDSNGLVKVSDLKAAKGKHQNQLDTYHVTGM